jgi:hypothetical protein
VHIFSIPIPTQVGTHFGHGHRPEFILGPVSEERSCGHWQSPAKPPPIATSSKCNGSFIQSPARVLIEKFVRSYERRDLFRVSRESGMAVS